MNDSENRFEEALRDGLAARTDDLDIPEGLGRGGIRRARRRSATRAAIAVVPVIAAVIVVVLLAAAPGTRPARHPPMINAGDVVRRVDARIKLLGPSDGVYERITTSNKQRTPVTYEWQYTAPRSGIFYDYQTYFDRHGVPDYSYWDRDVPLGNHRVKSIAYQIEPPQRSYGVQQRIHRVRNDRAVGIESSGHSIAHDLAKGHVDLRGIRTVRGIKTRRLQLKNSIHGGTTFLYVDASTYQPIEEVYTYRYPKRHHLVETDRLFLLPATGANIAKAVDHPDLKGYTRR